MREKELVILTNFYLDASKVSDHVVFVSTWLKNIYVDIGMNRNKTSVILAGANKEILIQIILKNGEKNILSKL